MRTRFVAIALGQLRGLVHLFALVGKRSQHEHQQQDYAGNDEKRFLLHLEPRKYARTSNAMMAEKATADSRGIVTKPNHSITFSEHGTPCVQGLMLSGIDPGDQKQVKNGKQPAEHGQRQRVADHLPVEGEHSDRQYQHQRKHEDALVPAEDAGRQLHDFTEEQRAERRGAGDQPGSRRSASTPLLRCAWEKGGAWRSLMNSFRVPFPGPDTSRTWAEPSRGVSDRASTCSGRCPRLPNNVHDLRS